MKFDGAVGARIDTLFGVALSGLGPEVSVALTKAVLARQPVETGRRIIITWPAKTIEGVLPLHGVTVEDADTGEQIVSGFKLTLGTDVGYTGSVIEADVTALVDEDGEILAAGAQPVVTEEYANHRAAAPQKFTDAYDEHEAAFKGELFRTRVYRFAVAEMRIQGP